MPVAPVPETGPGWAGSALGTAAFGVAVLGTASSVADEQPALNRLAAAANVAQLSNVVWEHRRMASNLTFAVRPARFTLNETRVTGRCWCDREAVIERIGSRGCRRVR